MAGRTEPKRRVDPRGVARRACNAIAELHDIDADGVFGTWQQILFSMEMVGKVPIAVSEPWALRITQQVFDPDRTPC